VEIGKWYHITELPVRRGKMAYLMVVTFQGRMGFLQGLCIFQPEIHSIYFRPNIVSNLNNRIQKIRTTHADD